MQQIRSECKAGPGYLYQVLMDEHNQPMLYADIDKIVEDSAAAKVCKAIQALSEQLGVPLFQLMLGRRLAHMNKRLERADIQQFEREIVAASSLIRGKWPKQPASPVYITDASLEEY